MVGDPSNVGISMSVWNVFISLSMPKADVGGTRAVWKSNAVTQGLALQFMDVGGFLKWRYSPIIHFCKLVHYRTTNFGYPHLWKPAVPPRVFMRSPVLSGPILHGTSETTATVVFSFLLLHRFIWRFPEMEVPHKKISILDWDSPWNRPSSCWGTSIYATLA